MSVMSYIIQSYERCDSLIAAAAAATGGGDTDDDVGARLPHDIQ